MTATLERSFGEVLGEVLGADVPPDGHFFDDLGADSMVMARFCARVRKRADLPTVSMKDVYRNPTVRGLAGALAPEPAPAEVPAPPAAPVLAPVDVEAEAPSSWARRVGRRRPID